MLSCSPTASQTAEQEGGLDDDGPSGADATHSESEETVAVTGSNASTDLETLDNGSDSEIAMTETDGVETNGAPSSGDPTAEPSTSPAETEDGALTALDPGSAADSDGASDSDSEVASGTVSEVDAADASLPMLPQPSAGAVTSRGGDYFGFAEQFNRYYTDPEWTAATTLYVSPDGAGSGVSADDPANVEDALSGAGPSTRIVFTRGQYTGCYELDDSRGGSYEDPVVLYGERNADGSLGVTIDCCDSGRQTCINLEAANYVAVDGFELNGGAYGVRSVGAGYGADEHQRGVAVLNSVGHDQDKDPFFTGQSDWFVIEHCTAFDTGEGDGHGIYLSNGSDWNVVRFNETFNTVSSDFQINADPQSTCADDGIAFDEPECDAVAGSDPTGGRGASDFFVVASNFFHHSLAQGPNFTSVRNSVLANNVLALPARHGTSFWQETDNPRLGASNNVIAHNLFITSVSDRQILGITNSSVDNEVVNNVFVAVNIDGDGVSANAGGQLLATDSSTVGETVFTANAWLGGYFGTEDDSEAYVPDAQQLRRDDFDAAWFSAFPTALARDVNGFAPSTSAPWLDVGALFAGVTIDRAGQARTAPVDLGPFER